MGLPPTPSRPACFRRSNRCIDCVPYWRSRDGVHPVRLQRGWKIRPRGKAASPGETEEIYPDSIDDEIPAVAFPSLMMTFWNLSKQLHDDIPASGEGPPAPVDDAPAVVVDDVSPSERFLAYCCGLSRMCDSWPAISTTVSS